ncbi:MAG: hypothetical protein IT365_16860 [Candidatus Hydrogenedentes bacterium]|nr:hypothetical protein [Candidatus Hydrogenedentota bacterium]
MNAHVQTVLTALRKRRPEEYLLVFAAILILLVLTQGVRCGATLVGTSGLLRSLEAINAPPARAIDEKAATKYEVILSKGILGRVVKDAGAQQLRVFGILGKTVLMGSSPENIKPYELDAEVDGGEKLVKIENASVILEKDGKQRTLEVFPKEGSPAPDQGKGPGPEGMKPGDMKPPDGSGIKEGGPPSQGAPPSPPPSPPPPG